jgi:hypothetical protein
MRKIHPVGVLSFELAPDASPWCGVASLMELALRQAGQGAAWIVESGPRHLFLCGIVRIKPGVGELWMMRGRDLARASRAEIRFMRRLSDVAIRGEVDRLALRRLHCLVRGDSPRDLRFARFAGFTAEDYPLTGFGPAGETIHIMKWRPRHEDAGNPVRRRPEAGAARPDRDRAAAPAAG